MTAPLEIDERDLAMNAMRLKLEELTARCARVSAERTDALAKLAEANATIRTLEARLKDGGDVRVRVP